MDEQQFMKWFLEISRQEYNGRKEVLTSNINLIGQIEK